MRALLRTTLLLQGMPIHEVAFTLDGHGRVRAATDRAKQALGPVEGAPITALLPMHHRPRADEVLRRLVERRVVEVPLLVADGTERRYRLRLEDTGDERAPWLAVLELVDGLEPFASRVQELV